ncbi:MAG: sulfotransferase [Rubrobacteraceae bacterium]
MRPLFVSGCERSGTTAFADYLNEHPRILVLRERYRFHPEEITPDLFDFDRIMDFTEADRDDRRKIDGWYKNLTARMLAAKDPSELAWIGDKDPFYLEDLEDLQRNNPGARFIILYRPVEEVAESWQARSADPEDVWPGEKDFEIGVRTWNRSLNLIRSFIQSGSEPEVLLLDYHDFFYRNEPCAGLISRFLELDFDTAVREAWEDLSLKFEAERRPKTSLSEEQLGFIKRNKDSAAEAWITSRISEQWGEFGIHPGRYADPAVRDERQRAADLLAARGAAHVQALKVRKLERQLEQQEKIIAAQRERNGRLGRRIERLTTRIRDMENSKVWRMAGLAKSIRRKVLGK